MKNVMRQVWRMINKRNRKKLIGVFFITIVSALLEMLGVSLIVPIASAITAPDSDTNSSLWKVLSVFHIHNTSSFISIGLLTLIIVYILKNIVYLLNNYIQAKYVCECRNDVQNRLLFSFLNREYEYYLNSSSGEIVRIVYGDVTQTFYILRSLITLSSELLISFGLLVVAFLIDWQMTLFVAVMLVLLSASVFCVIKPALKREGISLQESSTKINNLLIQVIDGIKVIKVSGKGDSFAKIFKENVEKRDMTEEHYAFLGSIPRVMIEVISICSVLGYLLLKTMLGYSVDMLLPALSAFVMAAVKLMPSATRIVGAVNEMTYNRPAVSEVYKNVFYFENHIFDHREEKNILKFNEKIELRELSFRYPDSDKYVFYDSEISIEKGSTVGIVGVSGSGKTTLVDVLLGLLSPQQGKLIVDGVERELCSGKWLFSVGYIPQSAFLIDASIKENIAFGVDKKDIDIDQVNKVIKEAQIDTLVESLPEGIETKIGEKGVRLSGGQRQRIGIARALYNNPELLVFDEATSALDNDTEKAVMDAISELKGRKTIIIIAHRTNTLKECDCIYRVENTKIYEEEKTDFLFQ